jgi:hypothetical protein
MTAVRPKYQFSTCARAFLFDFLSMQQQQALLTAFYSGWKKSS